jgi:sigma-E factor negative regulatory protein RseA
MKNQSDERISSLMDSELDAGDVQANFLLDAVIENDELRRCWGRYHFIGDALRHNLPDTIDMQLSSRVMAVLEDEPTVLLPSPLRTTIPLSRRIAGLAVAASVTAVAVLGVQFTYKEDGALPAQPLAQAPVKPNFMRAGTAPADINIQTVTQTRSQLFNQSLKPVTPLQSIAKRPPAVLSKYFIDHNQQAARVVQGVMPYARIITYPHSPFLQHRPEQPQR